MGARMKLKKLEEWLQTVDDFENPKIKLEQYQTPPHIASHMIWNIQSQFGDIEGKVVGDLGSGCGMLSIGAFMMGAAHVVGFEVDRDAIESFSYNINEMEMNIDCIQCDVTTLETHKFNHLFDTIVLNPPFGTKNNSGIDIKFLQIATQLSKGSVYSLHKTSTRDFIKKKAKEWELKDSKIVAQLRYNLPASYKFHKKSSVDIEVDFWRFEC